MREHCEDNHYAPSLSARTHRILEVICKKYLYPCTHITPEIMMDKPYVLSIRTLARDMRSEIDRFPEDLESNLFSLSKNLFGNFVGNIGERIGEIFVAHLVKKEEESGKNYFYLDTSIREFSILKNPERYSADVVEAFNSLCKLQSTVPDFVVIKCTPNSTPKYTNPDCIGCSEIYQFKKLGPTKRIKDSCKKFEEILCYEVKASASGFKFKRDLHLTFGQKVLIERARKMEYVRLYLVKIDLSEFSENRFTIAVERLG